MVGNCPPFFLKTTKLSILHRLFECLPAFDIVVWPNVRTGAALIAINDTLFSKPMPISVLAHMMTLYATRNSNGLSLRVTHRNKCLETANLEKVLNCVGSSSKLNEWVDIIVQRLRYV